MKTFGVPRHKRVPQVLYSTSVAAASTHRRNGRWDESGPNTTVALPLESVVVDPVLSAEQYFSARAYESCAPTTGVPSSRVTCTVKLTGPGSSGSRSGP